MFLAVLAVLLSVSVAQNTTMPCPFSRELAEGMEGSDVTILQTLLQRDHFSSHLVVTGKFDAATKQAVSTFQSHNNLPVSGAVNATTATAVLHKLSEDGYKDDGTIPAWALYKVHVPVYKDRTRETIGTLYNNKHEPLFHFKARTHGVGTQNEFCGNGNTPTGLGLFDLNSPEDDPKSFGPYPVNRIVQGLKGNQALLLHNDVHTVRNGILLHTGEWDNWDPSQPMPNSHGCIHTHPDQCDQIWQILVKLGVQIRKNTDGSLPYPYKPQGIISVEQID